MISNMVRLEIGRNIKRWQSLVAFLLLLACFIQGIEFFKPNFVDFQFERYNFFTAFLYASGAGPKAITPIIIPIIAGLIAGDSLAWDQKTKYGEYSLLRTTYMKYIVSKMMSVAITTFLFVFLTELVALVYSYILFPNIISPAIMEGYVPTYALSLFEINPVYHLILIIINVSLLAMMMSLISLFISTMVSNIYVVVASPLLLFIILEFTMDALGLSKYSPYNLGGIYLLNNFSYGIFEIPLLYLSASIIMCLIIYVSFARKFRIGVSK